MPFLASGEPLCVVWVGNFFRPEFDQPDAMRQALTHARELGFNGFVLDSKQWQDFADFYAGAPPSPYVAMQQYAIATGAELGLGHMFLALYLNGDNLYAEGLRAAPPIYGEEAVGMDGQGMHTYKYWSPRAQVSMVAHVQGLLEHLGNHHLTVATADGEPRLPLISMFDPIITPSFDAEGQARYLTWLSERYVTIERLNARYGTTFTDFAALTPTDYWFGAEHYIDVHNLPIVVFPPADDWRADTAAFRRFVDNQLWRAEEYQRYFAAMADRFAETPQALYMMPILSQWQHLFAGGRPVLWKSTSRALDPWLVGASLDSITYNLLPADAAGDADPYALSYELSVCRSASRTSDFVAGLDICRYIENDVYRSVAPAEAIATTVLHGAQGLHVYGYNGLDDGGSLKQMPAPFGNNVRAGTRFFKEAARHLRGKTRLRQAAILYPRWMALFATPYAQEYASERSDSLGWFRLLSDLGYAVDILHPTQIPSEQLDEYRILVLPWEPYYRADPLPAMANALAAWVQRGGTLVHGAGCQMLPAVLDPQARPHPYGAIHDDTYLLPLGFHYETFAAGEPLVCYTDGAPAASSMTHEHGRSISIGFHPGLAYTARQQPFSAGDVGINEVYQFSLVSSTFLSRLLFSIASPLFTGIRGVEQARFDDTLIAVNHNPYAVPYPCITQSSSMMFPQTSLDELPAHGVLVSETD